jgi:hypothetical protein
MTDTGPRIERPYTPDYGIPETLEGTLPWSWAVERLDAALQYWMGTTRPDGSPHVRPIWGAWAAGAVWFEGGPRTRWARNLAENPACTMAVEHGADAVIVEGRAELVRPDKLLEDHLLAGYEKYIAARDYRADPANWREGIWRLSPVVAFGWSRAYPTDATRWRFGEAAGS